MTGFAATQKGKKMDDTISKQSAIDMTHKIIYGFFDVTEDDSEEPISEKDKLLLEVNKAICNGIKELPSAQSTGAQDILQYLDEYLHPIVSPEHWSVYSELYDMVSMLPSAQQEPRTA